MARPGLWQGALSALVAPDPGELSRECRKRLRDMACCIATPTPLQLSGAHLALQAGTDSYELRLLCRAGLLAV